MNSNRRKFQFAAADDLIDEAPPGGEIGEIARAAEQHSVLDRLLQLILESETDSAVQKNLPRQIGPQPADLVIWSVTIIRQIL